MMENSCKFFQTINDRIENAGGPAIFGGAFFAADHALRGDFDSFINVLPNVIKRSALDYDGTPADACRVFCEICLVDPALIEAYIGMRFEALCEHYTH